MGVFVIGSLFCAVSQNISQLIIARVLQGLGACSGIVMAISIVKDYFHGKKELSNVLGNVLSVTIIAPIIAPVIGSYLLAHFNWQANFYFLGLLGVILLLATLFIRESYPKHTRTHLPINRLFHAYREQIRHKPFLFATIAVTTNFSAMFAFIASSPFIFIKIYHISTHLFGYFFAINAVSLALGIFLVRHLRKWFNDNVIVSIALSIIFLGGATMLCAIYFSPGFVLWVSLPLAFVTFAIGMLYPELTSYALKYVVTHNGLANSLLGTFRFTLAAATSVIMGILIHNSAIPLAIVIIVLNLFTTLFVILYFKSIAIKNKDTQIIATSEYTLKVS